MCDVCVSLMFYCVLLCGVVVVVFLFFFKQKTAYEMRISDWSSDVCSSDLFAARRGNWKVMLRGAFHSRALKNLLHPESPVGHTLHIPSGQVKPLFEVADLYRQAEIGRASWRERVCQYG